MAAHGTIMTDKSSVYFGQQIVFTPVYFEFENNVVVTYAFRGRTGTIFTKADTDQMGRYTWNVPMSLAQYCSGDSGVCTITASFYRGGSTLTGTDTVEVTFNGFNKNPVTAKAVSGNSAAAIPASGIDMGSTVRFAIERYGGMTSVTLRYKFTGKSTAQNTIAAGSTGTSLDWVTQHNNGSASSPSYMSFGTFCPDRTSGSLAITVESNLNSTVVRTDTITIKLNAPTSWIPTVSSVSASEMASAVLDSGMGIYLKGESRVRLLASGASGSNGSTIAGYRFVFDGSVYTTSGSANNAVTTDTLKSSGTLTYRVTVTDTRGRTSAEKTGTLTAYDYTRPTITTAFKAERCNSDGSAYQSDGTKVRVTFGASYSKLTVSGTNKNSLQTCQVAWSTGGDYTGDSKTFTISTSAGTASANNTLLNGTYSNTTRYTLRLTVQDKLYSVTAVVTIPTQLVTLDFKSNGLGFGIGMMSQNNYTIDSAWTYRGTYVQCLANSFLQTYRTDYSANATPSNNIWGTIAAGYDSNNAMRAYIRQIARTNGDQGVQLETMRVVNGETKYNTLNLHIDASGNKNVNVSDPAAWRSALGLGSMALEAASSYLPVAGGTMTGRIDTKITSWDNASAPSAARSYDTHYVTDANNRSMTFQRIHHGTDNTIGVEYGVRRQISSSSTLWNTLTLRVAANGTRTVTVSDAAAWRTALGLGSMATQASSSYLPISGGTLTGVLNISGNRINLTNLTDGTQYKLFGAGGNTMRLEVYSNADHSTSIYHRAPSSSYFERFLIPAPSTSLTGHKYYNIVTTKYFQRGTVNPSSVAANSYKSGTVTFATPYANSPVVVVGLYGGNDNVSAFGDVSVRVKGFGKNASTGETTGFTYEIDNANSSSRNIGMMWVAYADS